MTPAQSLACATVAVIALITAIVLILICKHLKKKVEHLAYIDCSAARAIDHLAAFIDAIKVHSQDVRNDPDIQKLAYEALTHVEEHRRFRKKPSPQANLLIQDLCEMSGQRTRQENLPCAWAALTRN